MKQIFNMTGVTMSVLLTACGGSGGGSTSSAPVAPPAPAPLTATIVTTVPPASYTGEAANAFALWNAERSLCGFGLLTQNAALDAAASAHAAYSAANNYVGHDEIVGKPGFTGATPTERIVGKGYPGSIYTTSEVMTGGIGAITGVTGNFAVRSLFSAPYHLRAMVDSYRDVGIGMGGGAVAVNFVGNMGYQTAASPQLLAGNDVKTVCR